MLVDPHFPLLSLVEHDHSGIGSEESEDVDQHFKTDQCFLQQVDYLSNRQHLDVLQPHHYFLSLDP